MGSRRITALLLRDVGLASILRMIDVDIEDVISVAVPGQPSKKLDTSPTLLSWVRFLAQMISGPLGADRIDYLLRDSYHTGVTYGLFDPTRVITGMTALPRNNEPYLGIKQSNLHNAEAMMLARYFMFTQVYLHKHRRIYDIHLVEFLKSYLEGGKMPTTVPEFLKVSDVEILSDLRSAWSDPANGRHSLAERVIGRKHYRPVLTATSADLKRESKIFDDLCRLAEQKFGRKYIHTDRIKIPPKEQDFLVLMEGGQVMSALSESDVIRSIPSIEFGYIFASPEIASKARLLLGNARESLRAKMLSKSIRSEDEGLPLRI